MLTTIQAGHLHDSQWLYSWLRSRCFLRFFGLRKLQVSQKQVRTLQLYFSGDTASQPVLDTLRAATLRVVMKKFGHFGSAAERQDGFLVALDGEFFGVHTPY